MDPMFSKPLTQATVQEIQLEMIRRTRFNGFDGERVVAWLLAHRDWWEAVLMDRIGISQVRRLPGNSLIKLRDLPDNFWNVDTLYVLASDADRAMKLAKAAETEDWGGMILVHSDREDVDGALGTGRGKEAVVTIWWD